jgi:hypothetical protein
MTRTIIRTATIALATAALAAPTALARPADTPPSAAAALQEQDLRSADATDAATRPAPESQDLRTADAIDAATRPGVGSQASVRAHTTPRATADRGITWATIAIGSLLAIGTIAGIAGRTRRTARARITA